MKQVLIDRFVRRLEILGGLATEVTPDRRALAALRRSLATWPFVPPDALRVVAPFVPEQAAGWRETVYYLTAALFALHPCESVQQPAGMRSFALSLREAASREAAVGGSAQGPERRLLALLNCRSEGLPVHLRHAVAYLKSRDVTVDYRALMQDLSRWDSGEGVVQRRWGRDFWAGSSEVTAEQQSEAPKTEENG